MPTFNSEGELNYNLQSIKGQLDIKPLTGVKKAAADFVGMDERGHDTGWGKFLKFIYGMDPLGMGMFAMGNEVVRDTIMNQKNDDVERAYKNSDYQYHRQQRFSGQLMAQKGGFDTAMSVMGGVGGYGKGPMAGTTGKMVSGQGDPSSMVGAFGGGQGATVPESDSVFPEVGDEYVIAPDDNGSFSIDPGKMTNVISGGDPSGINNVVSYATNKDGGLTAVSNNQDGESPEYLTQEQGVGNRWGIFAPNGDSGKGQFGAYANQTDAYMAQRAGSSRVADQAYASQMSDNAKVRNDMDWVTQMDLGGPETYFAGLMQYHESNANMEAALDNYIQNLDRQLRLNEYEFVG